MNECNCNQKHGSGVISNFCVSRNCGATGKCGLFKTEVLPVGAGTDAKGEPMAPKFGAYANTIVQYLANGAVYFYDSKGIYTKINDPDSIAKIQEQLETEIETREQADKWLQENINAEVNARVQDVNNLQTNINQEVETREAQYEELHQGIVDENVRAYNAEQALSTRIDEVVNSPDVRYIKQTYAELEAIEKSTIGDQDYARVLTDETHDGEATYYQFNKAQNAWEFVGTAGAYYTESEIDSKFDMVDHDIQNLVELTDALPNVIVSDVTSETTNTGITLTISKSTVNSGETITDEIVIPTSGSGGNDPRLTNTGAERANRLPDYVMTGFTPAESVDSGVQLSISGSKLYADGPIESTTLVPLVSATSNGVISIADKTKLDRVPRTVVSAAGIRQTSDDGKTSILVKYKNTATGEAYDDVTEIPVVSAQYNGLMSVADKAKLDGLSAGDATAIGAVTYSADTVNLGSTQLTAAKGTQEGMIGQAGIMSSLQATQLAALAQAYEAEEKGTILYEGTASVNNVTLSESGLNYDHLIVVAEYMGMGSSALKQQVSAVFYPTENVKAFQMTATDLTVGDAPAQATIQDIWMISDDGLELDLASSIKAQITKNGSLDFEATPETTSMFTITKVVGFGKKLAGA